MDYVYAFISLFAGLGAFLIGFKILSENIEKMANSGLKKLFDKTSKNRFIGVGIGALVTAIIQSSGAATVMIVGFVNAGMMDLFQATAMIMGANIGTTITAQIVALQSFNIVKIAMIFAFIGIFMTMLAKKSKAKTIGMSLAGLGLVFLALSTMSNSMDFIKKSETVINILNKCNNPFLLLMIGVLFTALIQSSSVTTTILITMVTSGVAIGNGGNAILYVVLGSNIGSCVTALFSSVGASPNAKRASLIHLMFNVFGTLIFFIILLCWPRFMDMTFAKWFAVPATQIAMFHTFFNIIATVLFIPFITVFVRLAKFFIKETETISNESQLDDRFLKTPAVAVSQVSKETLRLGYLCVSNLSLSIDGFLEKNEQISETVLQNLENIETTSQNILRYLVKLSSLELSREDEVYISKLHKIINDFYREAEISENMTKYTKHTLRDQLEFSENVYAQIKEIQEKLNKEFDYIKNMFEIQDFSTLDLIDKLEDEIDELRSVMINDHIERLEKGSCSPANCGVYINLVSNLERAGDHLNYVAHALVDQNVE